MPKVPLPQVSLNPIKPSISSVDVSPETFGAGLARPLAQAADIAQTKDLEARKRKATDEVTQASATAQLALNTVQEEATSVDYTGGATKDGWSKTYVDRASKAVEEAASRTTSPEAAAAMREQGTRALASFESALNVHVVRQKNEERKFNNKLLIQTETAAAKMNPMDANRLSLSETNISNMVAANSKGLDPEKQQELQRQATSQFYAEVIGSIPDENATQAFALFETAKKQGKLSKDDEKKVGDSLEAHKTRVIATTGGDKIWVEAKGDFGDAMARAGAIEDVPIKLATEQRIRQLDSDRTQALKQHDQSDIDAAWTAYQERKPVDRETYTRLLSRNPQTLVAVDNEKTRDRNVKIATNYDAWGGWMALSDEEMTKAEHDPRVELQGKIPDALMNRAITTREAARNRLEKKATPKEATEIAIRSWINGEASRAKLKTTSTGKFSESVYEKIAEFQSLNEGRNPTAKELKQITDDAMIEGVIQKPWYLPNLSRRKFQVEPGDVFVPDQPSQQQAPAAVIPDAEAAKIRGRFAKAGVATPSEAQIRAQWELDHAGEGARP